MVYRSMLIRSLLLGAALASTQPSLALDKPVGRTALTISGKVSKPNDGPRAVFDMAMLAKLPQQTFTTKTPWYPQPVKFTGPLLRDVLAAAGATGSKIVAVALNDYKTEIPFADAQQHDVIVARLMNDKPMPVREKGPLFIVYPFDTKTELRAEIYYNRSAWQLNALQVQ
ncbi:molybdopterin-dependent oxidoreductase [Chitinimonas sp. JJ19]|uniref:molybdopterin-dependent oxidoreductase n=1 Tax=Chitinimonas sp. JJ19 TaxID=3109352 RepID=UPI0030036B45